MREPIQVGDQAPEFTLPAVNSDGSISLADYRGRTPLLLSIARGLYCPFCRRHIAHLGSTQEKLREFGVETLAIVTTKPERARLYFRYRPARVPLAADPDRITHRSYGLPRPVVTPELLQAMDTVRVDPTGELPEPVALSAITDTMNRLDGFELNDADRHDMQAEFPQLTGQFLVDSGGVVRWANIECSTDGLAGVGKFPSDEELVAAAKML